MPSPAGELTQGLPQADLREGRAGVLGQGRVWNERGQIRDCCQSTGHGDLRKGGGGQGLMPSTSSGRGCCLEGRARRPAAFSGPEPTG